MRNFILTLVAMFAFNAVADIGLVNRSTSLDATGTLRSGSLEKFFVNVKNASGGALENGDVVVLDVSADDGYSVTTSTTAGAIPHCVLAVACAVGAVCKCQTYGLKTDVNFDRTNAASTAGFLAFISEDNAGKIEAEAKASIAGSDYPVGVFMDTVSASGDVELFIRLR